MRFDEPTQHATYSRLQTRVTSRVSSRRAEDELTTRFLMTLILLGALLLLWLPRVAHGYSFILAFDGKTPYRWDMASIGAVPWRLSRFLTVDVDDPQSVPGILQQAFSEWGQLPDAQIDFGFEGFTGDTEPRLDAANLITLGSDLELPTGVIAVTLVNAFGGRIYDADIVFNKAVPFTTTGDPERFDFQAVATHEIGHLLGLEHSGVVRATMAPFVIPGDPGMSTLESDDRIGASVNYVTSRVRRNTGTLAGVIRRADTQAPVFLANVVATNDQAQVIASGVTDREGFYKIEGLPPGAYFVFTEPFDGPVTPFNLPSLIDNAGAIQPNVRFLTKFH
jgi:Matrixin